MTVFVQSNGNDVIAGCAPIVWKFIGEDIKRLADWMRKQGGFRYFELKTGNTEAKIIKQ